MCDTDLKNEKSEEEEDLTGLGNGARGPAAWSHLHALIGFKDMAAKNCPQSSQTVRPADFLAFGISAWTIGDWDLTDADSTTSDLGGDFGLKSKAF